MNHVQLKLHASNMVLTLAGHLMLLSALFGCAGARRPNPGPQAPADPGRAAASQPAATAQAGSPGCGLVVTDTSTFSQISAELRSRSGDKIRPFALIHGPTQDNLSVSWLGADFPRKPGLNLTVYLTDRAIFLSGPGGVMPEISCSEGIRACLLPETASHRELVEKLYRIKESFPRETALTVTAEPQVPMTAVGTACELATAAPAGPCPTMMERCTFDTAYLTSPETAALRVYLLRPGGSSKMLPVFKGTPALAAPSAPPSASDGDPVPPAIIKGDVTAQDQALKAKVHQRLLAAQKSTRPGSMSKC